MRNTLRSITTVWTAAMYVFFFFYFKVRIGSRDCRAVIQSRIKSTIGRYIKENLEHLKSNDTPRLT